MIDAHRELLELVKGFLDAAEGEALYSMARQAGKIGPCLEIGSYCGKSTIYIGAACRETNSTLFAIDHHTGSEEQQPVASPGLGGFWRANTTGRPGDGSLRLTQT